MICTITVISALSHVYRVQISKVQKSREREFEHDRRVTVQKYFRFCIVLRCVLVLFF